MLTPGVAPNRWNPWRDHDDDRAAATKVLLETVAEILTRAEAGDADAAPGEIWNQLENSGMTLLGVADGADSDDFARSLATIALAASYAAPIPLMETTLLSAWMLASSGLGVPAGRMTSLGCDPSDQLVATGDAQPRISGRARAPWAADVEHFVVLVGEAGAEGRVGIVDPSSCGLSPINVLSGRPDAIVQLDDVPVSAWAIVDDHVNAETLRTRGALGRAAQIAGAVESMLAMTVRYAGQREQFGRPIGSQQAIQQQIAILASESAALAGMVDIAAASISGSNSRLAVAAAKTTAGVVAARASKIAHQVHGAIGVTHEHDLHRLTTAVLTWRDDFGSEHEWAELLGHHLSMPDAPTPWELVTGTQQVPIREVTG